MRVGQDCDMEDPQDEVHPVIVGHLAMRLSNLSSPSPQPTILPGVRLETSDVVVYCQAPGVRAWMGDWFLPDQCDESLFAFSVVVDCLTLLSGCSAASRLRRVAQSATGPIEPMLNHCTFGLAPAGLLGRKVLRRIHVSLEGPRSFSPASLVLVICNAPVFDACWLLGGGC